MAFLAQQGLLRDDALLRSNILFVPHRDGPRGKGALARQLGISHFVDDREECLQSVLEDPYGNCAEHITRHSGVLYHFLGGQAGRPVEPANCAPPEYHAVWNWSELLVDLTCRDSPQARARLAPHAFNMFEELCGAHLRAVKPWARVAADGEAGDKKVGPLHRTRKDVPAHRQGAHGVGKRALAAVEERLHPACV